jgi:hypothetical protein
MFFRGNMLPCQADGYLTGYVFLSGLHAAWAIVHARIGAHGLFYAEVSGAISSVSLLLAGAMYGISRSERHKNGMWVGGLMAFVAVCGLALLLMRA